MTDGTTTQDTQDPCGTGTGSEPEPSDSLKAFGAVLKVFRRRAGFTQEEFAPLVGYAPHTVGSIEQGRRFPPRDFVERAEEVLDGLGALRAAVKHVSRRPGLASWFRQWARLEEQAISLNTYECRVIPGLLQTEEYSRTLFENRVPHLTDDQVESQISARRERQRLLRDRPKTAYSFLLDEHILLRRTGGAEVTRNLIGQLLDVAALRNVEIQVMPLARGVHAGMDGPICLLESPDNQWFGYAEGQESGQFVSDPKAISVLHMRYAKLRSQALTPDDSVGLLQQMRGAL